jgi:beta-1,4-mannosyltransferase
MVRASYAYEEWFARSANLIFTVSDAMSRQLKREFKPFAPVKRLHDRPTSDFRPVTKEERMEFLLDMDLPENQRIALEEGRLKVLVSSTSWTPDEDFSILLDALVGYSSTLSGNRKLPELLVVITGKGPQKSHYLKKIAELEKSGKLKNVSIKTAWLPTFAYARLLASADLGISLHQSSSGVDLPMKVVDMFGAGLPVAGYSSYESWPELVKEGVNGRGFSTTEELHSLLTQLLSDDGTKLAKLRDQVLAERVHSWDEEWAEVAAPAMGYTTQAPPEQQAEQANSD